MEKKNPESASFVTNLDLSLGEKLQVDLVQQGFEISHPPYTLFSAKKKGVSCTLYRSGKLMVQGKEMKSFIEFYLEPEILKNLSFSYADLQLDLTSRIGCDEAGKGDFFGSLCVAAIYSPSELISKLRQLGVKDSKLLTDKKILGIAAEIRKEYPHEIIRIGPKKYNEIYPKFGNLNSLLAWGHATAIEQLTKKTGCKTVIVDKFAHEKVLHQALHSKQIFVDLTQKIKAEEDLIVAAASILARAAFLDSLSKLGEQAGMEFPKGASKKVIEAGKSFVVKFGKDALINVAKLHFKTTQDVLA